MIEIIQMLYSILRFKLYEIMPSHSLSSLFSITPSGKHKYSPNSLDLSNNSRCDNSKLSKKRFPTIIFFLPNYFLVWNGMGYSSYDLEMMRGRIQVIVASRVEGEEKWSL